VWRTVCGLDVTVTQCDCTFLNLPAISSLGSSWTALKHSSACIRIHGMIAYINFYYRKRKLTDKSIPNAVLHNPDFAEDSEMYQSLLEMERKLDWTMTRKKGEIQDSITRPPSVRYLDLVTSRTCTKSPGRARGR